jgi:hypothetical protein
MYEDLVLKKQTILLFQVAVESTWVEVCFVTIRTAIFVYVLEIL